MIGMIKSKFLEHQFHLSTRNVLWGIIANKVRWKGTPF